MTEMEEQLLLLQADKEYLSAQVQDLQQELNSLTESRSWRMTRPLRIASESWRKAREDVETAAENGKNCAGSDVLSQRFAREAAFWRYLRAAHPKPEVELAQRQKWITSIRQKRTRFKHPCHFILLLPLDDCLLAQLQQTCDAIIAQSYDQWHLLLIAQENTVVSAEMLCRCKLLNNSDRRIIFTRDSRIYEKLLGGSENAADAESHSYFNLFEANAEEKSIFLGFLKPGNVLTPDALYEVQCAIEQKEADLLYFDEAVFDEMPDHIQQVNRKPAYSPDTLRSRNYIGATFFCRCSLLAGVYTEPIGTDRAHFLSGQMEYDRVLRLTERAGRIHHIPKVLAFSPKYMLPSKNDIPAIQAHLARIGQIGTVGRTSVQGIYRTKYEISGSPLVSILIPNCDHAATLRLCIATILRKTTYRNIEIVIVENNSRLRETFRLYREVETRGTSPNAVSIRVLNYDGVFNYAAINNFGAQQCRGEFLILLNNDTRVISSDWVQEMLMFAQQSDVGAVGALLLYPSGNIQHAGVVLKDGMPDHALKGCSPDNKEIQSELAMVKNIPAVTGACMMVKHSVYDTLNGLDEHFAVAFNDVDFCLRLVQQGYRIVWTPYACLTHCESESRGGEHTPENHRRFLQEQQLFRARWKNISNL